MKIQIKRQEEFIEAKYATIEINENKYRLSETIDGRLKVNKTSLDGMDNYIRTYPSNNNEIDIKKYRGIAFLQFKMTHRINQVFERRKLIAKEILENVIHPNQMLYAQEEIEQLDEILKDFLFIG